MIRPPFIARVAAGVALTLAEEARQLPTTAVSLPMTSVSLLLQTSMRMQQTMTSLAIKGDEAFSFLYSTPEVPSWAVFDEDQAETAGDAADPADTDTDTGAGAPAATTAKAARPGAVRNGGSAGPAGRSRAGSEGTGSPGRFALYSAPQAATKGRSLESQRGRGAARPLERNAAAHKTGETGAPEIVAAIGYDDLTLAQLRPRLRSMPAEDLTALLRYEQTAAGRAPFLTMLENRLASASSK